ncbi:VENN motif pre-toxin domain-containing protein, partial [Stenoxybacter acetivorans]|uniref:VENN motif pre-toxin domain-containing protein n=1 Tax=Stenoxybacter acetivorans TaxID=422441 RepID=UPI000567877B
KDQIRDIANLAAGLVGGVTGGGVGAVTGAVASDNAVVNNEVSRVDPNVIPEKLKNILDNAGITAEVTAALGLGGNVSITINQDGTATITTSLTTGAGLGASVSGGSSTASRPDGAFIEICGGGGGGIGVSACYTSALQKNALPILNIKGGINVGFHLNSNIGYQKTIKIKKGAAQEINPYNSYYKPIYQILPQDWK